ncbi:OmpA family protein [Marinoscillum sp. MHG1-6]|uniref:OmpA family protein n=1 Tax=Marinoscillum sp. MHG1-6 TaxID=2959627 RepID=UPI002157A43B|nr:OmpA family protein [Marinoscillum sp. MHG1-6]
MRYPIFLVSLLLLVQSCVLKQAQKSFDKGEFDRAIALYEKKLTEEDPVINFQIAEAYRKSNRLKVAGPYYSAAMKAHSSEESLPYYYAKSLKANQLYDEAQEVLENYVTRAVADRRFRELAQYELDNLSDLQVIEETPNYFRIKNLEELNTPRAEYSPVYKNGLLYFTSNRLSQKIYLVTGTPFTDIFSVKTRGANVNMQTLQLLDPMINNEDTNEGSVAISPDGNSIIFAKGNTGKATGNTEVNLYFTRFRNGQWLEPRPLSINDPDAWDSTPALTPDGNTLYFSSTREGGFGGADIYSAQLNRRGRWVDVKNLGPQINTSGEEVFPFVGGDGKLYFSSDGHAGFGNLDLFVASRERGKVKVQNLGEPMNSESDDFGLYQFDLTRGFFTSNRPGGKGDDDIYTFVNDDPDLKIVNYYLEGVTVTTDNGGKEIILPNTKVALVSENGEVVEESFTGEDGVFKFRVYAEENYDLIGEKTDYFTTRQPFSTMGKSVDRTTLTDFITNVNFESKIMMERIVIEKPIVLNNIYYDLDKANIRPDAAIVLDSLVEIMNDNPEIYVELGSHTDARADDDYNMDLSFRRARSAVQYMIRNGVTPERITAKGYGETKLIIQNARNEDEHQVNRRTEFKVLRYNPRREPEYDQEEGFVPIEEGTVIQDDGESDEYDRFFD